MTARKAMPSSLVMARTRMANDMAQPRMESQVRGPKRVACTVGRLGFLVMRSQRTE